MSAAELTSLLSSLLTKRTAGREPTIITLVGDATVFRPHGGLPNGEPHVALDALLGHRTAYRAVGRFLPAIRRPLAAWVAGAEPCSRI